MNSGYRYGLWGFTELWVISANGFGGHQKSWVIIDYGLPQRWVMTESTVLLTGFLENNENPNSIKQKSYLLIRQF